MYWRRSKSNSLTSALPGCLAKRLSGLLLIAAFAASLTACADRDSLVHRVKNYDANRTTQAPAEPPQETSPPADQLQVSDNTPTSGPVQLSRPLTDGENQVRTPQAEPTDDRLAFLDWFGNSADPAKVKDPVAELRKARAITAGMTPQPEAQSPSKRQAFVVSENSRLVPTYSDALPNPNEKQQAPATEQLQLRGADIVTGSVTPREEPASRDRDPAKEQLLQVDRQMRQTRGEQTTPNKRLANADPDAAVPVVTPYVPGPDNPLRLHIGLNGGAFDGDDTAALKNIAVLHLKTGRKIHIHGVSRGMAGDSDTRTKRVRRLHKHSKRAIAVLTQYGRQSQQHFHVNRRNNV